jgi:hypothetical protein
MAPSLSDADRAAAKARLKAALDAHDAKGVAQDRRIVATYDYRDRNGASLYQVRRYEPKDFRQYRPDGNGGWIPGIAGVQRVPFHLPEMIADNCATVFLCEGEKDTDRVRTLGLCATTLSGGTNWAPDLAEYFRGRDIVIVPDFNAPGVEKALAAANALHEIADTIRIVVLPGLTGEKDNVDVSDWLGADPERADIFATTCLDAPLWTPGSDVEGLAAAALIRPDRDATKPRRGCCVRCRS